MNLNFRKLFVSAIILAFFSLFLAGCTDLIPGVDDPNKVTPVYQGMVITKDIETLSDTSRNALLSGEIDQDDPFHNFGGETIETEIMQTYQVDNTPLAEYFAEVNEIVYITVKIYNPTSYEILSFTLNGQKYQSFQFESGSDSENLILKISAGETIGIKEFTIDQIKYVDGTEIKDVPIEGNQTVKLGVAYTEMPMLEVSNFESFTVSASMTIAMSDIQDVIQNVNGFAKVVLYDGIEIVSEHDIIKGTNTYEFTQLEMGKLYQYAVIVKYDILDGNHQSIHILSKHAFYTRELVEVTSTPTQDSTLFTLNVTAFKDLGSISKIELYKDNELVDQLDTFESLVFSNLLSDTLYEMRISYQYQLNAEAEMQTVISKHTFKTLAKSIPTLDINNIVTGKEAVSFSLSTVDIDGTGAISRIRILKDGEEVISLTDLSERQIQNLMSNSNYILEISYSYDLNDGQDEQVITKTLDFKTLAKDLPVVTIDNLQIQQDNIKFALDILDNDLVGNLSAIKLYQGQTEIQTLTDLNLRTFTDLLSNNNYTLIVIYSFNLNDGIGAQEIRVSQPILTLEKQAPIVQLDNLVIGQTDASFDLVFNKNGLDVAAIIQIDLFDGETLVSNYPSLTLSNIQDLLTNHEYALKISYTYDLTDGKGVQIGYQEIRIQTLSKSVPVIEISSATSDYSSIQAIIETVDIDQVGQITSAVVKRNNVVQSTLTNFDNILFTDLIPDSKHLIEITYTYDLNDGHGAQTIVTTKEIYTAPYITVLSTEVINTEKLTEGDTLVLEVSVENPQQMTFSRVQINGEYFDVSTVTTQTKIRVEFAIGSEYKGGTTAFIVEKIEGSNHNQDRSFDITQNNIGYAFVNGDIFVNSLKIVDEYDEPLDYVMPGEEYYVKIDFDNPTAYVITELNLSYLGVLSANKFTVSSDKQTVRIKVVSMESNTTVHINLYAFTYAVDNENKTKNVDNVSDFIVCVISSNYQMIYTPQDLANMRRGYSYKLANDIDLTDYNWIPKELNYIVLDGNGFAINNLRNVKTYVDTSVNYGLFTNLYASTIKNLTMNNVLIMITINNSTTQTSYDSRVGAIAGYISSSSLENININGEISVANNTTTWGNYVGGISGQIDSTTIDNLYVAMIISNDDSYTGFVSGYASRVNLNQTFIEGSLYGKEYTGGAFGSSNNSNINNTYVYADITGSSSVAGIIGSSSGSIVKNSYYMGQILVSNGWAVAGLVGYSSNTQIKDSFSSVTNANFGSVYNADSGSTYEGLYTTGSDSYSTTLDLNNIIAQLKLTWNLDIWSFKGELPVLKWEPTIRITEVVSQETSISFEVTSTDFDNVGEINAVELYLGNELVQSLTDFTILMFSDLRYNTEYRIKVTYIYDYLDGQGETFIYDFFDVKTLPTTGSPIVTIQNVVAASTNVQFELDINDINHVGNIHSIDLYDLDGLLIQTLSTFDTLMFSGLNSITSYRIVVTYQFDLGDSYGVQELVTKHTFRTHPSFNLIETNLLNTEAVIVGETLVIELSVDNPDDVQFTAANINGVLYSINYYDTDSIRIDIEADDLLGMGEVILTIDELHASYEGRQIIYALDQHNTVTIFINGDIYVTDIQVFNLNGNPLEYALNNESYIIEVSFYNPSGYDIPKLTVNETLVLASNEMYQYSINLDKSKIRMQFTTSTYNPIQHVEITNFDYTNVHMTENKSRQVSGMSTFIPLVVSKEVNLINNVNDLLAMTSRKVYKLNSDINMQGIAWTPLLNFRGVFDGNNHIISNLSIVKTFEDSNAYIGLFGSTNGAIIKNLHMVNTNFVVTIKSLGTTQYGGYVGTIVGEATYTTIKNVTVNSNIAVDNQTNAYNNYIGGVAGRMDFSEVNVANVSGNLQSYRGIGSVTAEAQYSTIVNIYTDATVKGSDYAGSFVGRMYQSKLSNSIANGIVTNYSFIGYTDSQSIYENVISMSKMLDGNYGYMYNNNQKTSDVYSPNYSSSDTLISYEQMISIMKTKWDNTVWSFGDSIPMLKFIPQAFFTLINADIDGVNFEFYIRDLDQVGELVGIELRRDGIMIQNLSDLSLRLFENLKYSTNYEIVLIYQYTYDEAVEVEQIEFKYAFMTADKENVPTVEILDVVADKTSVVFDLLIQDTLSIGQLSKIGLYDDHGLVMTLTDLSSRGFSSLLSNHSYKLKVEYVYDFNDGFGPNTVKVEYPFETNAMEHPMFMSMQLTAQNDAVVITNYEINDLDQIAVFYAYRLFKDNVLIEESFDANFTQFEGLLSSINYRFELEYRYDLNNGFGVKSYIHSEEIMTLATVVQIASIVTSASQDSIDFDATLSDPDSVGTIKKVELYTKLGVLVESIPASSGSFTSLDSYQDYEIRTYFEYSKNDGLNPVQSVSKKDIKTSPELSIASMSILNTEAIIIGDTMVLRVYLNNPSGILFTSGVINGISYPVSAQAPDVIRFDMNVGSQFEGGLTTLEVTSLVGSIELDQFNIPLTSSNTIDVIINGEISVLSVESLDLNYQPFDYYSKNMSFYAAVKFDNPTNYTIETIRLNTNNYGDVDYSNFTFDILTQTAYIGLTSNSSEIQIVNVVQFTYANENLPSRNRVSSQGTFFTIVNSMTPIEITTAQELQSLTSGNAYKLMNDIDLTGVNWQPIMNFKGVFDGNGYTISNLNIVKTYEDVDTIVGLFGNAEYSVIKNIKLSDVNIIINTKSAASYNYEINVGSLVGKIRYNSRLTNIEVNGYVSATNSTNGLLYVGGISGQSDSFVMISNNKFVGDIYSTGNQYSSYVGGISGKLINRSGVNNSYSKHIISGNGYIIGGLIGYMDTSYINNSYSVGSIVINNSNSYSGGLIGEGYSSLIQNTFANTTRNNMSIKTIYYCSGCTMKNVFSLVSGTNQIVMTHEQMLIQVEGLWNHNIWDFENTDIEGNPYLK